MAGLTNLPREHLGDDRNGYALTSRDETNVENYATLYALIGVALTALGGVIGSVVTAYISRRVPSADKKQDSLAQISTTLWDENRRERAEVDTWQEKYYNIYRDLQRVENVVTSYIKLQAKYQSSLLDRARLEARIQSLLQGRSEPEACGEDADG